MPIYALNYMCKRPAKKKKKTVNERRKARVGKTEWRRRDCTVAAGYKPGGRSGHAKFSDIRRENGRRRINTTFAVQFIKRHCCKALVRSD